MLDSGANHSIAGPSLFNQLPELKDHLVSVKEDVTARAINGSIVRYHKKLLLPVEVQQQIHNINVYYSEVLPYSLVLGYDYLRQAKMTVSFGEQEVTMKQIAYSIRSTNDTLLQPCSEVILWSRMKGNLAPGLAVLQPSTKMLQFGLTVANALVTIEEQKPWIPVRVLNPFPTAKRIPKNMVIATAHRLGIADDIVGFDADSTHLLCNATTKQKVRFQPPDEFAELFDLSLSTFTNDQKQELLCLLWEYSDIFLKKGDKLKCTDVLEFDITLTKDAKPFKASPYRSNPKLRKEISKQVEQMLEDDIIRPSVSSYGSPVLFVTKPDKTYRFVVDYRRLNSMTVKDNFPAAHLLDSLQSIGSCQAKYFSTMDLQSGYFQVPVAESAKPYTAFVTHSGLYEFNRMSFGLTNAPTCFSRLMSRVLQNLNWEIALL